MVEYLKVRTDLALLANCRYTCTMLCDLLVCHSRANRTSKNKINGVRASSEQRTCNALAAHLSGLYAPKSHKLLLKLIIIYARNRLR